jgi:hypothetical protein
MRSTTLVFTPWSTLVANFGVFRFQTGPHEICLTLCRDDVPARAPGARARAPCCMASRHLGVRAAPSRGRARTEAHRSSPLPRVVLPATCRAPHHRSAARRVPPLRPLPRPVRAPTEVNVVLWSVFVDALTTKQAGARLFKAAGPPSRAPLSPSPSVSRRRPHGRHS